MFHTIQTSNDIETFLDATNALHDGYIISVQFKNDGISHETPGCYRFDSTKKKLVLQILVTSLYDAIVEIEFEDIYEWQIRDDQMGMTNTAVLIDENQWITWIDDVSFGQDATENRSYVIARSMKWRIVDK